MFHFPLDEIKRKSFHLLSLIYILAYWLLPESIVFWGMGIFICIVLAAELVRLRVPAFNVWLLGMLGGVHREGETQKISGLVWTLSGSLLTMILFTDKAIVLTALFYMALGDSGAALFGKKLGKRKLIAGKTLEGSLACFVICLLPGLYFLDWKLSFAGALAATLIELIPWPLNDNFWMPLISAGVLTALSSFL